jgi:hypothetical protein
MTFTLDRLDRWRAEGEISGPQHAALTAVATRARFSLFVELNALLYVGVLALAGGLAWAAEAWSARWGDAAILLLLSAALGACLAHVFRRAPAYARAQVPSPGLSFDYVLYLGALILSAETAYAEARFHLLASHANAWFLILALVFFGLAYRFDNRFVLSLALATLGGWFGIGLSRFQLPWIDVVRSSALVYGLLVAGAGAWLRRAGVKPHFFDTYLHLGANAIFAACAEGAMQRGGEGWLAALLLAAAIAFVQGIRRRRFAFVVYGVVYAYAGVSVFVLRDVRAFTTALVYVVVSASAMAAVLIGVSRRFARDGA